MATTIGIIGAAGRMGRRLIALAPELDCVVVAAIDAKESGYISRDAGEVAGIGDLGIAIADALTASPDVLVDFSSARVVQKSLDVARERKIPLLIGTTGLSQSDHQSIDDAAAVIPVLQSANMSVGVAVLSQLVRAASESLRDWDVEIVETHHREKKDAPSGTALSLKDAAQRKVVPTHSLRIGDEVGRHTVYLATSGERLEFTHVATSRDTFARGALTAAKWLAGQRPGRYSIMDVFGLKGAQ